MVTLSSAKPTCRDCGGTGDDGSLRNCPACNGRGERREKPLPLTASELFRRNSVPPGAVAATHPLYEIQERARALETEIIGGKVGSTEVLVSHLLTMNMLVRGLIAVAIAEIEVPRG